VESLPGDEAPRADLDDDAIKERAALAAESLLGNEALTADLDDDAAKVLLAWGEDCAKSIARDPAGLDDAEAETAMAPRLRALRRLMRRVNTWIPQRSETDIEGNRARLDEIIEQAGIVYDTTFALPNDESREVFLQRTLTISPVQAIAGLRSWLENLSNSVKFL
jgi:hypothetical protein